jgi:hypothetical protein
MADEARRARERLKRLVADLLLDKTMLQQVARTKG